MSEEIISLSQIKVRPTCPRCKRVTIERDSQPQHGVVSMNGASLWTFSEACTMCSWSRITENVKVGA